jgi:hypothetical protein
MLFIKKKRKKGKVNGNRVKRMEKEYGGKE